MLGTRRLIPLVLLCVLVAAYGQGFAKTINVPADKATIQAAIDAAATGDEVVVAKGTYKERISFKGKAITVRSSNPTDSTVVAATIIDGQAGGTVVTFNTSEGSTAVLDGLTITGGSGSPRSFDKRIVGGGIYCEDASPTLRNNVVRGNHGPELGGGIYLRASSATLTANLIDGNSATGGGGGVYVVTSTAVFTNNTISSNQRIGLATDKSSLTLTGNTVTGNEVYGLAFWNDSSTVANNHVNGNLGPGVLLAEACTTLITGNTITGNVTDYAGGGILCYSSPTIVNNTVTNNRARVRGGGINCEESAAKIDRNLISGNVGEWGGGGGISCGSNTNGVTITNNTITRNTAGTGGGGVWLLGSSVLENNLICGNSAYQGGGVQCYQSGPTLTNNTICGNSATEGGGLYYLNGDYNAPPTLRSNIIALNTAGGGVFCWAIGSDSPPDLAYCDCYANVGGNYAGMADPTGTNGNIAVDPLFANTPAGDYHLKSKVGRWSPTSKLWVIDTVQSPCIDKGDPAASYSSEPTPNGERINMGAYGNTVEASKSFDGNEPPSMPTSVTIAPAAPKPTDDLTATASGSVDPEGKAVTYEYAWAKSTNNGATWSGWDLTGATLGNANIAVGDTWKARARASDGKLQSNWRESSWVTVGNTPPTAPTSVKVSPGSPTSDDNLVATAVGSNDADGNPLTYSYEWASHTVGASTWGAWGNPGQILDKGKTTAGEQWKARARAYDGTAYGPWVESGPVPIGNSPPTAPTSVTITPLRPMSDQSLIGAATGSTDPDGTTPTYTYEWARMAVGSSTWGPWGFPGRAVDHSKTTMGEKWKARARAFDGTAYSGWTESLPVTIGNARPTVPKTVDVNPWSPTADDSLTATGGGSTDADGTVVTYTYEWARRPAGSTTWGAWGNAGPTLDGSKTTKGEQWKARARAFDGLVYSGWRESRAVPIANTPPTAPTQLTVGPVNPKTDDDLVAVAAYGGDAEGGPIAYVYEWAKSVDGGKTWGPYGNPGATLSKSLTTEGDRWKVHARSFDGTDYSPWKVSAVVTIGNTDPTMPTVVAVTPTSPVDNDNLVATGSGSTDADGTSLTYSYEWAKLAAGSTTWGAWGNAGRTLNAGQTAVGDQWKCRSRAFDGAAYSYWTESAAVTIGAPSTAQVMPTAFTVAACPTGSGAAQITVGLTAAANVEVTVLNLAGRIVAVLPERDLPRGLSTLLWSGRSVTGTSVPNGRYLVRVTARGEDGSQSQVLAGLSLAR